MAQDYFPLLLLPIFIIPKNERGKSLPAYQVDVFEIDRDRLNTRFNFHFHRLFFDAGYAPA
jgi:hypothetical protein